MNSNKFRFLMLITNPRLADRAAELFNAEDVPLHYHIHGCGTASSEMMDILGLGTTDKGILATFLPKNFSDDLLLKLRKALRLGTVNSGIAFTIPMTGANSFVLKKLGKVAEDFSNNKERKAENSMSESKHALVAAIVDQGHSEDVMNAARGAGARGGTVIHSHQIGDETAVNFWGISLQDEKEVVLIVTDNGNKFQIMQAISKECGVNSDSKGFVVSLPIDTVIGINDYDE